MFNLAVDGELDPGANPARKVKSFQELNLGFRILREDEERKLLANATPYIQDLLVFDLNTIFVTICDTSLPARNALACHTLKS